MTDDFDAWLADFQAEGAQLASRIDGGLGKFDDVTERLAAEERAARWATGEPNDADIEARMGEIDQRIDALPAELSGAPFRDEIGRLYAEREDLESRLGTEEQRLTDEQLAEATTAASADFAAAQGQLSERQRTIGFQNVEDRRTLEASRDGASLRLNTLRAEGDRRQDEASRMAVLEQMVERMSDPSYYKPSPQEVLDADRARRAAAATATADHRGERERANRQHHAKFVAEMRAKNAAWARRERRGGL